MKLKEINALCRYNGNFTIVKRKILTDVYSTVNTELINKIDDLKSRGKVKCIYEGAKIVTKYSIVAIHEYGSSMQEPFYKIDDGNKNVIESILRKKFSLSFDMSSFDYIDDYAMYSLCNNDKTGVLLNTYYNKKHEYFRTLFDSLVEFRGKSEKRINAILKFFDDLPDETILIDGTIQELVNNYLESQFVIDTNTFNQACDTLIDEFEKNTKSATAAFKITANLVLNCNVVKSYPEYCALIFLLDNLNYFKSNKSGNATYLKYMGTTASKIKNYCPSYLMDYVDRDIIMNFPIDERVYVRNKAINAIHKNALAQLL